MAFFNSAIAVLQTLVVALGAGLGIWGAINLLEGYGNDNPGAKSQGMKQLMANLEEDRTQRKSAVRTPGENVPEGHLSFSSLSSSFRFFTQNLNRDFFPRLFVGD